MKRTKIDLNEEKQILINMITNTSFLRQLKGIAIPGFFQTSYAKIVAGWVWEYWDKTEQAPRKDIQDLYLRYRTQIADEEDLELVANFLKNLSNEYELNNITYAVKNAIHYFKLRSLEQIRDKLTNAIIDKNSEIGEKIIADYTRVEKPHGTGVDLFKDTAEIRDAYENQEEFLFSFPGALGGALGSFCRGDFFAILGAMKRGKSYWMWYTGRRAALMGYKVIHFSLEMTRHQMVRRAWQSFVGEPIKATTITLPEFIETDEGLWEIHHRKIKKKGVNLNNIEKEQKRYRKELRTGEMKMEIFPSYSTSLSTIKVCLDNLEYYDRFIPDVIVIDYADILLPESRGDYRHQLNSIWAPLRGWAQDRNCLVVTGSQTTRKGLKKDAEGDDVAEDVRKLAHVTKMISLNQNDEEAQKGIMRIKPLLNRDGKLSREQIIVLENREIGRIYLDSRKKSEVIGYD
jgi:hypothetical protein